MLANDNELSTHDFLFLACHRASSLWWWLRCHGNNHSFASISVQAPVFCPSMVGIPFSHKCFARCWSQLVVLGLKMTLLMAVDERDEVEQGLVQEPVPHLLLR